jgi:hypothetical protein
MSALMLVGVGVSSIAFSALNQTYLQTLADDEMRGRVMSLLTLTTFGLQPFGQLEMGALASILGPSLAVVLGGLVCAVLAVATLSRRSTLDQLG